MRDVCDGFEDQGLSSSSLSCFERETTDLTIGSCGNLGNLLLMKKKIRRWEQTEDPLVVSQNQTQ